MASVAFTRLISGVGDSDQVTWSLGAGDTGKPYMMANYPDRTVHITGTFGSVTLRGSNKAAPDDATSTDWFNLTDVQGSAITLTAAGGEVIAENPLWISPIATGGSGYVVNVLGVK